MTCGPVAEGNLDVSAALPQTPIQHSPTNKRKKKKNSPYSTKKCWKIETKKKNIVKGKLL